MDSAVNLSSTLLESIGPLFGVVIGALLAWLAARHQRVEASREEARDLAMILFGELKRIERHFAFVKSELPRHSQDHNVRLYTRLAVYGSIKVLEVGLLKFGFLKGHSLERLMELNFLIRNFDVVAQYLNEVPSKPGNVVDVRDDLLDELRSRSLAISRLAAAIALEVEAVIPFIPRRLSGIETR